MIEIVNDPHENISTLLEDVAKASDIVFAMAVAGTKTSDIEGVSAAGADGASRRSTPILDAAFFLADDLNALQKNKDFSLPVSPKGIVSPVLITRACLDILDNHRHDIFNMSESSSNNQCDSRGDLPKFTRARNLERGIDRDLEFSIASSIENAVKSSFESSFESSHEMPQGKSLEKSLELHADYSNGQNENPDIKSLVYKRIFDCGCFYDFELEGRIRVGDNVANCLSGGRAMSRETVRMLFEKGREHGARLAKISSVLVLAECVPAGTLTAMAVLEGLGYSVSNLLSSSLPIPDTSLRHSLVESGLRLSGLLNSAGEIEKNDMTCKVTANIDFAAIDQGDQPGQTRTSSIDERSGKSYGRARAIDVLSAVGDPMQPFAAGFAIESSKTATVVLAGGSQMLAVYALARSMSCEEDLCLSEPDSGVSSKYKAGFDYKSDYKSQSESEFKSESESESDSINESDSEYKSGYDALRRVMVCTTAWVAKDRNADIPSLAKKLAAPLVYSDLELSGSVHEGLRSYEQGNVKEGAGAGAAVLLTLARAKMSNCQLVAKIDDLYEKIFGNSESRACSSEDGCQSISI